MQFTCDESATEPRPIWEIARAPGLPNGVFTTRIRAQSARRKRAGITEFYYQIRETFSIEVGVLLTFETENGRGLESLILQGEKSNLATLVERREWGLVVANIARRAMVV